MILFGPALPFPSSSQVEGVLRELRPDTGRTHYRLLCRRSDDMSNPGSTDEPPLTTRAGPFAGFDRPMTPN